MGSAVSPTTHAPELAMQKRVVALRRMASLLAKCSAATSSLVDALSRLRATMPWKDGTAIDARMASTTSVTISSMSVKPRVRAWAGQHKSMGLADIAVRSTMAFGWNLTHRAKPEQANMDGRSFFSDRRQAVIWQRGCRVEGLLLCIALGIGVAALLAVAPGAPGNRLERFGLFGFFALWVVLPWYLVSCALLRTWRVHPALKAGTALLILFAWSLSVGAATFALIEPLGLIDTTFQQFLGDVAILGVILVAILFLVGWQAAWLWHWRLRSSAAEAQALGARLQPHFLFNSLNGISELVATDAARAESMIEALSRMLRAHLDSGSIVPLSQELALARDYLALESMRLGDRLQVTWKVAGGLPDPAVPSLCVQTLVENAVRHGVAHMPNGGELRIELSTDSRQLHVEIDNDLPEHGSDRIAQGAVGIGLPSARARLAAFFGTTATLETRQADGRFLARLSLPLAKDK